MMKIAPILRIITGYMAIPLIILLLSVTTVSAGICIKNTESKGWHVYICVDSGGSPCGSGSGIGDCTWGNPIDLYVPAKSTKCVKPTESQGESRKM